MFITNIDISGPLGFVAGFNIIWRKDIRMPFSKGSWKDIMTNSELNSARQLEQKYDLTPAGLGYCFRGVYDIHLQGRTPRRFDAVLPFALRHPEVIRCHTNQLKINCHGTTMGQIISRL